MVAFYIMLARPVGRFFTAIIIVSDRRSEVTICEIDSVRSCVTACCEAVR